MNDDYDDYCGYDCGDDYGDDCGDDCSNDFGDGFSDDCAYDCGYDWGDDCNDDHGDNCLSLGLPYCPLRCNKVYTHLRIYSHFARGFQYGWNDHL